MKLVVSKNQRLDLFFAIVKVSSTSHACWVAEAIDGLAHFCPILLITLEARV